MEPNKRSPRADWPRGVDGDPLVVWPSPSGPRAALHCSGFHPQLPARSWKDKKRLAFGCKGSAGHDPVRAKEFRSDQPRQKVTVQPTRRERADR